MRRIIIITISIVIIVVGGIILFVVISIVIIIIVPWRAAVHHRTCGGLSRCDAGSGLSQMQHAGREGCGRRTSFHPGPRYAGGHPRSCVGIVRIRTRPSPPPR